MNTLTNLSIEPMKVLLSPEYDSTTGKPIVTGEPDPGVIYVVPYEVTKNEDGEVIFYNEWIEWVYIENDFVKIKSHICV